MRKLPTSLYHPHRILAALFVRANNSVNQSRPVKLLALRLALSLFVACTSPSLSLAQTEELNNSLSAQSSDSSESARIAEPSINSIEAERRTLSEQMQSLRQQLESATENPGELEPLRMTWDALRAVDLILEQHIAALKRKDELVSTPSFSQELSREIEERRGKDGSVDFRFIEQLRDRLVSAKTVQNTTEELLTHAKDRLDAAKGDLKRREKNRRQAREKLVVDKVDTVSSEYQRSIAQLDADVLLAAKTIALREIELANEKLSLGQQIERIAALEKAIAKLEKTVQFTRSYLDDQITEIDTKIFDLSRLIESTKLDSMDVERRLSDARIRLEQLGPDSDGTLAEQIKALQMARETNQLIQIASTSRIERMRMMASVWERRFALANGTANPSEFSNWKKESSDLLDQMRKDSRLREAQLVDARRELSATLNRIDEAPSGSLSEDTVRWLQEEKKQLDTRARVYEADIAYIASAEQLVEKLLDELAPYIATPKLQAFFSDTWSAVQTFWGYEFTSIDESPITVSKLVLALVLLILSFTVSRRLSRFVGGRVVPHFALNTGAAAAIQSLLFYFLVSCFALLALHIVHIPLTLFTFFGGALAIGLGFGAQHVINHFISGLVLLIEQPIRVGDIVELDGLQGEVRRIGARSTVIRTGSNLDIIVPNSTFLEKNVINWTLVDNKVRIFVRVGVKYGSPTRKVASLMRKAVEEHGRVLKEPAPLLMFKDFGDNALIFEIHFWVRIKSVTEAHIIESDIRYRIDNLFRTAEIVIAYPQRDLHIESQQPLEVRVLPASRLQSRDHGGMTETRFLPDDTDA